MTRWGKLTKATRDRYTRIGARYGLTRSQTERRYNRGTFNPGSPRPERRVPLNAPFSIISDRETLTAVAFHNVQSVSLGSSEIDEYDMFERLRNAPNSVLIRLANLRDFEELQDLARPQTRFGRGTPAWLRAVFYQDENGKWRNPFWYHSS